MNTTIANMSEWLKTLHTKAETSKPPKRQNLSKNDSDPEESDADALLARKQTTESCQQREQWLHVRGLYGR